MAITTQVDRRAHKYRNVGGGKGFKRELFDHLGPHVVKLEGPAFDFLGDVLDDKFTVTAAGTAGAAAIVAGTTNGILRLTTGTDNDSTAYVTTGLQFKGDLNAVMETRLKVSELEAVKIEIGFTDALADAGAVNVLATPTYTATDFAVAVMDTDDTAPTDDPLQFVAAKAGTAITKIEPATARFVANEYVTVTVALRGDAVRFIVEPDEADGAAYPYYDSGWQANGIEGGTAVTPWIFVQSRDTDSVDLDIDYLYAWQSRQA
jgi:hypothetical protein